MNHQKLEEAAKNLPNPDAQWRVVSDHPVYAIAAGDYRIVQTPNQNNARRFGSSEAWHGIPSIVYAEYIALCSPANILALLSERNALAAQVAQMREALAAAHEAMTRVYMTCPVPDKTAERRAWGSLVDAIHASSAALSAPPSEAEKALRERHYRECAIIADSIDPNAHSIAAAILAKVEAGQ